MVLGSLKEWGKLYPDFVKGYTLEEQDWIGKFLLFMLLDLKRTVDHCRESGEPLPPILKSPAKPE
ncbi:MAG: hypothetical protein K2Z25_19265 [Beijerinckiaceae bacterium]|nr:hypothetical protein [Beijerinckiaceae bacterium]